MKTVQDYCKLLSWTPADLSRNASISWKSADKAMKREEISERVKRQIAESFSRATGEDIWPGNIEW